MSTQNTSSFATIKAVYTFCNGLFSTPDAREVIEYIVSGETDFEVSNVRFVTEDSILSVLVDELKSDLYMLGCFNTAFICDHQETLDQDTVNGLKAAEAYEALGKLIVKLCDMEAFAEGYATADGYGHHFNNYDFEEEEVNLLGIDFYVFDNHRYMG